MTTDQKNEWRDGWTAAEPASIGYAWAPNEGGEYVDLRNDGFLYRDLGLEQASDGALGLQRFKVGDPGASGDWVQVANDLDFFFLLDGSVDVEGSDGEVVRLGKFSSASLPRDFRYRLIDPSDDLDAVQVTAPAKLIPSADEAVADEAPVFTHDSSESYDQGTGLRPFFVYRDLGITGPTDGRLHIHVVKAAAAPGEPWPDPAPRTGWHYHSMAQWFMVLGGNATTHIETGAPMLLSPGDSQCLGRGPQARHNLIDVSPDYHVIELCLPAEYDTVAVDPPEGAAVGQ